MSGPTARDAVVDVLRRRGVSSIYGNPGTTELGLISRLPSDIEYVLCLQEAIAVGAATGHALATGRPSVVNLHALPGLGHAIGMLHGARLMHAPVVAIVGQQHSHHLRREPLLSGDLVATASSASLWSHEVGRPEDVAYAVERAFRVADSPPRGPVVVAVPMDFWDHPAGRVTVLDEITAPVPPATSVDHVSQKLARSSAGAVVIGDRVQEPDAWDALVEIVECMDLTVYSAPIGTQPGFPTNHPRYEGALPLTASGVRDRLAAHDVVVVLGAPVFTLYLHDGSEALSTPTTEIVIVTDDADEASRAEVDFVVLGDPNALIVAMAEPLGGPSTERETVARPERLPGLGLRAVARHIGAVAPPDTYFVDESMTAGGVVRQEIAVTRPRMYLRTSNGVLGTGLSAAVGAAIANPGTRVVLFIGDGSVLFAPQALWTMSKRGLPIAVIVLNNGGYESLRGFERAALGLGTTGSFDIDGIRLPRLAEAFGVPAASVETAGELDEAVDTGFRTDGPFLIDVHVEP